MDRKDQEIRGLIQKAQHPQVNLKENGGEILLQDKCPFTVFMVSHSVYRKMQSVFFRQYYCTMQPIHWGQKGSPVFLSINLINTFIFFLINFTVAWHIVACTITTYPFQKSPFFGLQNSIHVCGSLLSEESLFHFTVLFLKLWSCILKEFFVHSIHVYLLGLQLQLIFISWSITKQSQ